MALSFSGIPDPAIRQEMKANGFRYNPVRKQWVAKWYPGREALAKKYAGKVDEVNIKPNYAAKAEHAAEMAAKHEAKSETEQKIGSDMFDKIPFGQPILVGHYSEKADRNYRDRAWNHLMKGSEEAKTAEHYREKAERLGQKATGEKPDVIYRRVKKLEAEENEYNRFQEMCKYERDLFSRGYKLIAGIDEAGRGPLAGPVVAGAVILPENVYIRYLNDSKQLTPKLREELYLEIKEKAVSYGVGIVDEKRIDTVNILNAAKEAMKQAVRELLQKPEMLLIDAIHLDDIEIPQISIIKGDCLSVSVAAGSIIAKVTRDKLIEKFDEVYPEYGFARNKGYPTGDHIEAIKKYGICPIHRLSFTKNFT
jgi:ribonuclease HII